MTQLTSLTKAQLIDANNALRMECNTLRAQMLDMAECASALNAMTEKRPRYVQPAWQVERAAAMAAAKAEAMRLGAIVRA